MTTESEMRLRVFLCHASENKPEVRDLYQKLAAQDWLEPWLDEVNILPGQDWDVEIEMAVEKSDVVIVCLSQVSITKEGYIQREMKFGLDIALEKPEGTIFIIPLRLDECKPPRRIRSWQYVDYFPEHQRDSAFQRLLQSLEVRLDQKVEAEKHKLINDQMQAQKEPKSETVLAPKSASPKPSNPINVPTGSEVVLQNWTGIPLPPSYVFVGEMGALPVPAFFRSRDRHLSVLVSGTSRIGAAFLIDRYAITCQQYCDFLNQQGASGTIQTIARDGTSQAIGADHTLVVDAIDRWKKPYPSQPWLHASLPFGITCQSGRWVPVPGSVLLPITLVTWWGARLYSLWAHDELSRALPEANAYLPTPDQWQVAATWDPGTYSYRRYPWGDVWDPLIVNFSGYWAGRNITEADWQSRWADNPSAYASARPLPVADLEQNTSPVGCVQMLGNTWEWTLSVLESRLPIQGGCATSPMEHCQARSESRWPVDMPSEYIGFRCCYPLRRSA